VTLNVLWLLIPVVVIYWIFHTQPFLGFTENVPKERKYPVNSSSVGENVDWSDESQFLLQHSDVGSEFGVKNMKAWIHPALSQRFRLVVV